MAQISEALLGKVFPWKGFEPVSEPVVETASATAAISERGTSTGRKVEVWFGDRRLDTVGVEARLGKENFKKVHADAAYMSDPQFRLFRQNDRWFIEHIDSAKNETVVDGRGLKGRPLLIDDGMRVAVGNTAKKIEKFPLILRLVT
jgi:hypothetical protein